MYIKDLIKNNNLDELNKIIETYNEFIERSFPPVELEEFFNITGISKIYKLPFNLDEKHLEAFCYNYMDNKEITNLIFNELIKLNEELIPFMNLKYKEGNHYKICSVIGGVCSRMNITDIDWFLHNNMSIIEIPNKSNDYNYKISCENNTEEYNSLYNQVYKSGTYISYFPSIRTLRYISELIK